MSDGRLDSRSRSPRSSGAPRTGSPRARRSVHDAVGRAHPAALHRARPAAATRSVRSVCRAQYPFTRGVYRSMYRGRLWTMRQFAGFGTAEETNERFRYLLDHGQTGLSTAFDMPSLMGHDSDHPRSLGEVGREGVAVDTVLDMETLFRGIPLDEVTRVDDDQRAGGDHARVLRRRGGASGHPERAPRRDDPDRHPQGVHRPEGVVLPGRSGDAAGHRHDRVVLGAHAALASDQHQRLPHPRGGLDRGAGAGVHAEGRAHLRRAGGRARARRGRFRAAAVSFFFNAQIDFFEEIAKYRAARRIWARELRDTFGARKTRGRG